MHLGNRRGLRKRSGLRAELMVGLVACTWLAQSSRCGGTAAARAVTVLVPASALG
jgi:hypothetical protein